jgi:hypothetical protein
MTDEEYTQQRFRECFSTPVGQEVLGYILIDLGYFDDDVMPEDFSKANYAKTILKRMGIGEVDTVRSFVNWEGFCDLTLYYNGGFENIHICDLTSFIEILQDLQEKTVTHFEENPIA